MTHPASQELLTAVATYNYACEGEDFPLKGRKEMHTLIENIVAKTAESRHKTVVYMYRHGLLPCMHACTCRIPI